MKKEMIRVSEATEAFKKADPTGERLKVIVSVLRSNEFDKLTTLKAIKIELVNQQERVSDLESRMLAAFDLSNEMQRRSDIARKEEIVGIMRYVATIYNVAQCFERSTESAEFANRGFLRALSFASQIDKSGQL